MRHPFLLIPILLTMGLHAQDRPDPRALIALVQADLEKVGFTAEDLADVVVKDHYVTDHSGVQHTFMRQRWQGIELWNGEIAVHRMPDGSVLKLNNSAVPQMSAKVNATSPAIAADAALAALVGREGIPMPRLERTEDGHKRIYEGMHFGGMPVTAQLVFWPVDTLLRLVWSIDFSLPSGEHWWDVKVDALTGQELDRVDRIIHCAFGDDHGTQDHDEFPVPLLEDDELLPLPLGPNSYRVYAPPVESPNHGSRSVVTLPWLDGGIASPFGWHDTNGASGAEHTITRGNNVFAREDIDGVNSTPGFSPDGGASLDFDFPLNLALAPESYQAAAITNLFFWNNYLHDVLYAYGFNEVSGNYQENNYGRGGAQGDAIIADALDGSGTNNANFQPTSDGNPGRMQMFVWDYANPHRTSDLDNLVICHEYGHGLSTRLVGGPSTPNCLNNSEQMGEGWSDYIGLMLTMKATDTRNTSRGTGTYLRAQPNTGAGIRPAPYTTDMSVNPYTYASTNVFGGLSRPHGIGFVWCTMLWEMTWDLIDLYGSNSNMYNGTGGNNVALRLVIDGMKLTPCSPGFVDARDAILAADQAAYGGVHQLLIRQAFARRGLGYFASQGSASSRDDQVESFELQPLNNNLAVEGIIEPVANLMRTCGPWLVKARVRNMGLLQQDQVTLRYQLDNGPIVVRTVEAPLSHMQSIDIDFPLAPLELVDLGQHSLRVWLEPAGDELAADNEKIRTINLSGGRPLPHYGGVFCNCADGWGSNSANPTMYEGWYVTNTAYTPACAQGNVFRRVNADAQYTSWVVSPFLELSEDENHTFSYRRAYVPRLNSLGTDTLRVKISTDCGHTWSMLQQHVAPGMATAPANASGNLDACGYWVTESLPLTGFAGQTIILRLEGASGLQPGGNTYVSQMIMSAAPPLVEVALMDLVAPADDLFFHCDGTPRTVSVSLYSGGSQPVTGFNIGYRVNGGPWVTETFVGTMVPGTFGTHVFATPMQFTDPGAYTLDVKVFINDQNLANNELTRSLELVTVNTLNTPPWPYAVVADAEDGALVPIEWNLQNSGQDQTWENVQLQAGKNCSTTRAWLADHIDNPAFGSQERLVSPVLQLNPDNRATLRFDHAYAPHPDPLRADGFRVDLSLDCGASWVNLFDQAGVVLGTVPATSSPWEPTNCTHWRSTVISLADYDAQAIMVRFVAINANGNRFYMDNLRVEQLPYVNGRATTVDSPNMGNVVECGNDGVPVIFTAANYGALPLADMPVRYRVDNGPWVNEVAPGPITTFSGVQYTFAQRIMGLAEGVHTIRVETNVPGEQRPEDDFIEFSFTMVPNGVVPAPFFEGVQGGAVTPPGWVLENQDGNGTWTVADVPIGAPGSGCLATKAWSRDFFIDAGFGHDRLVSPQIDLSALHGTRLKFDHAYAKNVQGGNFDALRIEVSNDCGETWTSVFHKIGTELATAPNYSTSNWAPANCDQWTHNNIDLSAYDGQVIQVRIAAINGYGGRLYVDNLRLMNEEVLLSVKFFLEGPYNSGTQLMADGLRTAGLIPLTEPYSGLGFQRVADPGITSMPAGYLGNAGNSSVVDWVMVELRKLSDPSQVAATRCVLLRRDGTVMRPDNASTTLRMPGNPGNYYVSVRHRNHLGVMTASPVLLNSSSTVTVDFTTLMLQVHGTEPMRTISTRRVLWSGNVTNDGRLKYTGPDNDRDPILQAIGGTVPSNTFNGYTPSDVNMDGVVKYTGPGNDRDIILQNIGGVVPSNTRPEQLP
jgi:hypothetical protein